MNAAGLFSLGTNQRGPIGGTSRAPSRWFTVRNGPLRVARPRRALLVCRQGERLDVGRRPLSTLDCGDDRVCVWMSLLACLLAVSFPRLLLAPCTATDRPTSLFPGSPPPLPTTAQFISTGSCLLSFFFYSSLVWRTLSIVAPPVDSFVRLWRLAHSRFL